MADRCAEVEGTAFGVGCIATTCHQVHRVEQLVDGKVEVVDRRNAALVEQLAVPADKDDGVEVVGEPDFMALRIFLDHLALSIGFCQPLARGECRSADDPAITRAFGYQDNDALHTCRAVPYEEGDDESAGFVDLRFVA